MSLPPVDVVIATRGNRPELLAQALASVVDQDYAGSIHCTVVFDQSLPDLELKVVKVMAPGLRHFWRRLGPGRLYTVPVELGWLPAATAEERMNPRSVFF